MLNRKLLFLITALTMSFFIPNLYSQQTYILLGWNDLGMHCANQDFSKMAVLPPYNDLYAQLIIKSPGLLPQIVVNGYKIEYSIPGNTYSVGKTNFWTYAQQLFNLPQPLPPNIGLTGKGLTGLLDTLGNCFRVLGIPNTPYTDNNLVTEAPFQTFHLIAKTTGGTTLTYTDNVIPVSNEIGCVQSGCHTSEQAIKNAHETVPGFNLNGPELCARCHASNALGTLGDPEAKSFSFRMHDKHDFIQPAYDINTCYKCHPGPNTQCFRDVMRVFINNPLICQDCHGSMAVIASTINAGRRPWFDEPKCGTCHGTGHAENLGTLYRNSKGHGNLYCPACHNSPHAIVPTREANDNLQSIRVQGHSGVIRECMVCHSTPPTGPGPHGLLYIGIKQISTEIPSQFKLEQNYPNPFNSSTNINFCVMKNSFVNIKIYDAQGKMIKELVNHELSPGIYKVNVDANNFSSGLYMYRMTAGVFTETKKMVLVK
jgi:hypothetical protein